MNPEVVILSGSRTPIGSFQGSLAAVPAPRLAATTIAASVAAAGLKPAEVTDVYLGQVLPAGAGQAPTRQATLAAGLPPGVRTVGINKVCGSGLEAVAQARRAILLGEATVAIAGGMESMSQVPFLMPKAREGYRLGHQTVWDGLIRDGLWDPHHDLHMGTCAERCAAEHRISRIDQDAFAADSYRRAQAAQAAGLTRGEIAAVEFTERGKVVRIDADEGPGRANFEKMATLKPAFDPAGTITAANASSLNDGAASLLLTSSTHAASRGLRPIARVISMASRALDPLWFTTAPVPAIEAALAQAGWAVRDVDLWEINEAFAVVPLYAMRKLGLYHDRVNVRGGAIALGHPLGASGARILVTLIAALRERGLRRGVAALCIGGGEGIAACIECL